jgi:GNAT superfamily N-acetyltransferase
MTVREAMITDTNDVLAFVRAKSEFDRHLGAFSGTLGTSDELVRRHLFGPRPVAFALLAEQLDRPVGFALYYFRYSSFRGRPSIWLDDLFVYPSDRRQGAGGQLMSRLTEVGIATDCTHIAWVASASNTVGMNFYRKLGAIAVHQVGDAVTLQVELAEHSKGSDSRRNGNRATAG